MREVDDGDVIGLIIFKFNSIYEYNIKTVYHYKCHRKKYFVTISSNSI